LEVISSPIADVLERAPNCVKRGLLSVKLFKRRFGTSPVDGAALPLPPPQFQKTKMSAPLSRTPSLR
jgi:hypothetical protein